jgi:hypothetical protein
MKTTLKQLCVLFFYLLMVVATQAVTRPTASVTLAWDPSPDSQVVGYYVYAGTTSGSTTNRFDAGNALNFRVAGLAYGKTNYFVVKAYDVNGNESDPSNEISYVAAFRILPPPKYELASAPSGSISSFQMSSNKTALASIATSTGDTYRLWATSDLRTWELVRTFTAITNSTPIEDPAAASKANRFYRVEKIQLAAPQYQLAKAPTAPVGSIMNLGVSASKISIASISTTPGKTYRLWATTDLRNWEMVQTVTATTSTTQIEDLANTKANRFYRVEQL